MCKLTCSPGHVAVDLRQYLVSPKVTVIPSHYGLVRKLDHGTLKCYLHQQGVSVVSNCSEEMHHGGTHCFVDPCAGLLNLGGMFRFLHEVEGVGYECTSLHDFVIESVYKRNDLRPGMCVHRRQEYLGTLQLPSARFEEGSDIIKLPL